MMKTILCLSSTKHNTQPALFALEYALATTWRFWGLEPAPVLGHSVGEYVAACLAGIFSLDTGCLEEPELRLSHFGKAWQFPFGFSSKLVKSAFHWENQFV
jgi:acyl transferase domain-containing protein